jgi:ABC-type sugar transport system permease subunit
MVVAFGILKSIPRDYFEAARIDGASNAYIFRSITLPIVFKAMKPTLIMSLIMQFNQFGIYLLTQGGPASDKLGAPGATDLLIQHRQLCQSRGLLGDPLPLYRHILARCHEPRQPKGGGLT